MTSSFDQTPSSASLIRSPQLVREILRLLQPFWKVILLTTVAGSAGGMAMAWALSVINGALVSAVSTQMLLGFAGLCALSLGGQLVAGVGNSMLGQKIVARLRQQICSRILRAPLSLVEQQKSDRLLAVLNGDIDKIAELGNHFAGYTTALAIVIGCLAYLLILSPPMLGLAMALGAIGWALNHAAMGHWVVHFDRARGLEDKLQKQYRSIIEGAKELRLNDARRRRIEYGGTDLTSHIARLNSRAFAIFWVVDTASIALVFVFVAAALALRPYLGIDGEAITGFVIVILFAKGPLEELASALPVFSQAKIAFGRVSTLAVTLDEADEKERSPNAPCFRQSLGLRNVRYAFASPDQHSDFDLDIPDLEIKRGEITFIVGGNGSGKTTLVKVLLGLYRPHAGALLLDGQAVAPADIRAYRNLFSGVFADYHLFDELVASPGSEERVNAWLHRFGLANVVDFERGAFSTTDLSTGQRKRLAFIHAVLEDRPILMLDEWAADQDPEYRALFYTTLLPELRSAGKTVIAISHDDRYFNVADRIIHLSRGRIVAIEPRGSQAGKHAEPA
ncbi:cyclic peptide export ABC transporter [Labrys neptuniae]|uniref:Cyclic peptide export ABC transporter n=1 Tax=Labrys neptuniae TaxID=376174 RepID=A0ABV3PX14_9HYPH